MPSLFLSLKKRKSRTKPNVNDALKRKASRVTPSPNQTSSKTASSDPGSGYSKAGGGQGGTDTTAGLAPPPIDVSEMKPMSSGDDLPLTPAPTPKMLSPPGSEQLSRVPSQNPPSKLTRRSSKISFSDMKFGGSSMLGGYGRKSQHRGVGDNERSVSEMRAQVSKVDEREGQQGDKQGGSGTSLAPIHGIMKTATNVSTGGGAHSVRFTLDLPPRLDLDLNLSVEKVGNGSLDRKDEGEVAKNPSRWGETTAEAVLNRSKIVSAESVPREDCGGKAEGGNGDLIEKHEDENLSLKDNKDEALSTSETHLHRHQSVPRYSRASSISTVECEPSFTILRLEDLVRVQPRQSGEVESLVVPHLGRISSGQQSPTTDGTQRPRASVINGKLEWVSGIEEADRSPASSINRVMRGEESRNANQSNGCVSA